MRGLILCLAFVTAAPASTLFRTPMERHDWKVIRGRAATDSSSEHDGKKSLRVEPAVNGSDAEIRSAPIDLVIGKTYQLTGWVRTRDLTVRDAGRSPIASGAALQMASMPFDVHSASLGGTREWTQLSLRFVATRAQDEILLTVANGGEFKGRAWFEGVNLEEASPGDSWPAHDAVRTFGPAYRYPAAGWIYLHIEGKPYERGYQHGYLMAKEIPEYLKRCAFELAGNADKKTWDAYRTTANALFLRGFDAEILEEMRGIADGANAAGASWLGRRIDLIDIVVANTTVEMGDLADAVNTTPTGIENSRFDLPPYAGKGDSAADHCSAFAAIGPATRDGKMVIGHVTWWPQTLAEQTNVMLDIQPEKGHRVMMQSYPGGIESGTDWYQNDAGIVLTETTLRQTPFNIAGTPVAFRARLAIQYSANIDDVVKQLGAHNNGLYTNEWLIGDARNNEVAMYELGTSHSRLWRSSKDEWFGGTTGFYWGDNNAKDLDVNLEYLPDPHGAPEYAPYVPAVRDEAWQSLYRQYKGQIDEQFAFKAFDGAPLVYRSTMDAKVATAAMANNMMVWAEFGRPNESVMPPPADIKSDPNHGLYPGGYYVMKAAPDDALRATIEGNEKDRLGNKKAGEPKKRALVSWKDKTSELWKGWVLPAAEPDTWFVAGSAQYYQTLQAEDVETAMDAERIRYRAFTLAGYSPDQSFRMAELEGELFLDTLRRQMGDEPFLKLMRDYFAANTTKTVTAHSFLVEAKVPFSVPDPGDGPAYLPEDIRDRLATAVIVYGTTREAGTNRYVAERLQREFRDRQQREVPIYKDFEATNALLGQKDVIFVGRPETNSALAAWRDRIGLDFDGAVFRLNGKTYASERDALVYAAKNPVDPGHMVVVYAGNSPLETVYAVDARDEKPWFAVEDGKPLTGQGKPD